MATGRIPTPDRGQPIDVSYIYQIVDVVNSLATSIATSTNSTTSVDTPTSGKQSVKTAEARIIGGYREVISNSTTANNVVNVEYPFQTTFQYPPIVTVTPTLIQGSDSGGQVTAMIKSTMQDKVSIDVRFSGTGNLSVGLNLIIVGIPRL